MSKNPVSEHQNYSDILTSFDGEPTGYRRTLEALATRFNAAQALLTTTFPRGGSVVLHPATAPETFLRLYAKDLFVHDGPTWQAVLQREPVTGDDAVANGTLTGSNYFRMLMEPQGWSHVAAVRVPGPVFRGYPGALHLYRRAGEPAFSTADLRDMASAAEELGHAIESARDARVQTACGDLPQWSQASCCRQFIFNAQGKQVAVYKDETPLDDRLKDAVRALVQQRLGAINGQQVTSDRSELVDNHGEVWAFRTVVYKQFPALGDGPFIFMCLQPSACEWNAVKQTDFQGDPEIARLIPTLKFMQQDFQRSPTLDEIAAKAHLSPFHFHRRFTELLGQTPKHFLLACQIQHAKRKLMERKVTLADIAAECGFAHQSHFTSRFKQATGLTPTRWRRFATEREESAEAERVEQPGCAA